MRATVTDVHGQTIAATTVWTASSPHISIDGEGAVRTIALAELAGPGRHAVTVVAEANGGAATTTAELIVIDGPPAGGPGAGIPEPVLVDEPAASWRSRLSSGGWRVNIGHADYRALSGEPRARLRYLVALFASTCLPTPSEPSCEGRADLVSDQGATLSR